MASYEHFFVWLCDKREKKLKLFVHSLSVSV